MKYFIVQLYKDAVEVKYLADWEGDPARTHSQWNAKKFETKKAAQEAIEEVLKDYPNRNYSPEILTIETTTTK